MTADALPAAVPDAPPRPAPRQKSPRSVPTSESTRALTDARQSVVDVVAARIEQVAEGEAAGVETPDDGAPVDPAAPEAVDAAVPEAVDEPFAGTQAAGGARADAEPAEAPAGELVEADGRAGAGGTLEEPSAGAAPVGRPAVGTAVEARPDVAEVQAILQPTAEEAGRFAAAAVLDVLRASGWADADEAHRLRSEADRLRELLDLVVRDHRAREAATAGLENQQHHWLIPLLRAAHGVAFGSLGAKVALRTAVQGVPENVLHAAGLRIDYGVEHTGDADPYDER